MSTPKVNTSPKSINSNLSVLQDTSLNSSNHNTSEEHTSVPNTSTLTAPNIKNQYQNRILQSNTSKHKTSTQNSPEHNTTTNNTSSRNPATNHLNTPNLNIPPPPDLPPTSIVGLGNASHRVEPEEGKDPESVESLIEHLKRGRSVERTVLRPKTSISRPHSYHQQLSTTINNSSNSTEQRKSASFNVKMNFLDEVEIVEKKFYAARNHFHQYWRQVRDTKTEYIFFYFSILFGGT